MTDDGTIVVDTPEAIAAFRMLAVRRGLGFEIKTGMKMSRGANMAELAREYTKTATRNKAKLYAELDALMAKIPGIESSPI